jgi:hypothetical protein
MNSDPKFICAKHKLSYFDTIFLSNIVLPLLVVNCTTSTPTTLQRPLTPLIGLDILEL